MRRVAASMTAIAMIAPWPVAARPLRAIISAAIPVEGQSAIAVELTFLDEGAQPAESATPDSVPAMLHTGGLSRPVMLRRIGAAQALPPGGFVRARYRLDLLQPLPPTAALSLSDDPGAARIALSVFPNTATAGALAVVPNWDAPEGNDFLDRVTAYQPVYVVGGLGTDSDGKIQISLKYRLFDLGGGAGRRRHAIHVGYTQRMLWDLGAESIPFRNIDFQPELFYLSRGPNGEGARLDWQLGYQHQSNGRSKPDSRSYNIFYLQPSLTTPLGDYALTISPRAWLYFGNQDGNEDIERYRGHTGLSLALGEERGLKLATTARLNFATGKGAVEGQLSYPLNRLIARRLNLYLFGQAFTGYGEGLIDYDRRTTRVRIGVGFVR